MEPVFMVLGQSAAILAVRGNVAVQRVDRGQLRQARLADGQVLEWSPVRSQ
jgi:hypothetical protein